MREYQPGTGRFTAEDVIKGNGAALQTLNRYGYCWGNALKYIDINGREPEDYEYVYYVNNPDAAGGFGHTAFLLVKENGMAEYYSYSTVSGGESFEVNINDFVEEGSVNKQWYSNGQ